ncbi:MAG: ATP-dependent helicase [Lachnospiraceae bacterium]|nr:ATP-dependent helicase [Lachnospiraceae bacterium]
MTQSRPGEGSATMAQLEAMHFGLGQMLILAGPGSGKTRVITGRIRYLIEEAHVAPQQILTITFTKSAAMQMKQRAIEECSAARQSVFGTFHSFFYQILRTSGYYQGFSFISPYQQQKIIKSLLERSPIKDPQIALSAISYWKNTGKTPPQMDEKVIESLAYAYMQECRDRRKLDFDDLLLLCKKELEEKPLLLSFWQKRFTYLQIDEFQDINPIQYDIVRLLCAERGNLFVVGDDDQSIYSFRGSDPSYMKLFLEDYPKAKTVMLDINFRCAKEIVDASIRCISNNSNRFDKQIKACETATEGKAAIRSFDREEEETAYVISELSRSGTSAILVRTNAEMERFAADLVSRKIPFFIREKRKNELGTEAVKDFMAFLRFACIPDSPTGGRRKDLLAFMNKPERGLSRRVLTSEIVDPEQIQKECRERGEEALATGFQKLFTKLSVASGLDYFGALTFFWKTLGYERYCRQMDEGIREANEASVNRLFSLTHIKNPAAFLQFYEEYERGILQQPSADTQIPEDRPVIMTFHGAKGLEFDNVFLPGVNEGAVPHGRNLTAGETEEERRMFYVAMTRAKERLVMSYVTFREASIFLEELHFSDDNRG